MIRQEGISYEVDGIPCIICGDKPKINFYVLADGIYCSLRCMKMDHHLALDQGFVKNEEETQQVIEKNLIERWNKAFGKISDKA